MNIRIFLAFFLLSAVSLSSRLHAQVIITVSGITTEGYEGDGGLASHCQMHWPEAIALNDSNNIFIADADNNVIREIDGSGKIRTVVGSGFESGTGEGGYGGDGGPASAARLNYPSGVAFDPAGNMYIADRRNSRIRMVNPAGVISTFAGNGTVGYTGDGAAASAAQLDSPTRVACDPSGNVYIADAGNNVIRMVTAATGNIATIAGNGTAGFGGDGGAATMGILNGAQDMAIDPTGIIYIADYKNSRIRKVDLTGNISTFAGIAYPGYSGDSGMATNANLFEPTGIATDAAGNVYFSDFANARIRKIDAVTNIITTFAGDGIQGYGGDNGPAKAAKIYFPQGLAINSAGGVYICDKGNNRLRYASTTLATPATTASFVGLNVFPNPGDGQFTLHISSASDEKVQLILNNLAGQKVKEISANTNQNTILDLNEPPGVYFISAVTAHGTVNSKVFIR